MKALLPPGLPAENTAGGAQAQPLFTSTTVIHSMGRPQIILPTGGGQPPTTPPTEPPPHHKDTPMNTPAQPKENNDDSAVIMITPFAFSLLGLLAYMGAMWGIWKLIDWKYSEWAEWKPVQVLLLLITIYLWFLGWRKQDKSDKKPNAGKTIQNQTDTKKTNQIPDGFIGILEFLESPIRKICLSEGTVWAPPFMDIKSQDAREEEFQVPETAAENGVELTCSDNVIVVMRASVTLGIDNSKMYGALYRVGLGAAKNGMRNAIISAARDFAKTTPSDQMVKDTDIRNVFVKRIRDVIEQTAEDKCLSVKLDTLKIPKLVYEKSIQEAKQAAAARISQNKAVDELSKNIDKRMTELMKNNPSMPQSEALRQARLEHGLITRQEVDLGGSTAQPMVQIPNPSNK